ncbi:response regulator transcription factor [Micromonospora sp. HM134]|uniref:LuxR C-terminal-related transcriptional regulator n=1 Tax=Micromonospora sp. HM134 TaxID=2583243 RepID=UPI00197C64B6|nr:response regulator transcription factor [Micromonospora sp. HM134]
MRELVREALEGEPDIAVVEDTASCPSGIMTCKVEQPDVVLLDVPSRLVAEAVRGIRSASPATRILLVSRRDDPVLVRQMLDSGVRGFLTESVSRRDLVASIRTVCADDIRVVLHVSAGALTSIASAPSCTKALTKRELEILSLVSMAMSNRQISRQLAIAEGTVKRHLGIIFTKLEARSRLEAVNKAVSIGLIAGAA